MNPPQIVLICVYCLFSVGTLADAVFNKLDSKWDEMIVQTCIWINFMDNPQSAFMNIDSNLNNLGRYKC